MPGAAERWGRALAEWAIPDEILARAETSPWVFPTESFRAPAGPEASRSRDVALEGLGEGGSVLDVGCGGGAAAMALVPPATALTGVDPSPAMLELFADAARERAMPAVTILGGWPDAAPGAPVADVVVCHHVLYNVADVEPFVVALARHARRRVVVELSAKHPLSSLNDAWAHFWGLARPAGPTAQDFLEVLGELGLRARSERWARPPRVSSLEHRAEVTRIRLCLPASREPEVREFLRQRPAVASDVVTVWWDPVGTSEPAER